MERRQRVGTPVTHVGTPSMHGNVGKPAWDVVNVRERRNPRGNVGNAWGRRQPPMGRRHVRERRQPAWEHRQRVGVSQPAWNVVNAWGCRQPAWDVVNLRNAGNVRERRQRAGTSSTSRERRAVNAREHRQIAQTPNAPGGEPLCKWLGLSAKSRRLPGIPKRLPSILTPLA
ncbi:MAG: hypothetical protein JO333_10370 [Verrucomicrobia bacterium]|nr:hypothetical protein [Verrucomicrobiota bacterium]